MVALNHVLLDVGSVSRTHIDNSFVRRQGECVLKLLHLLVLSGLLVSVLSGSGGV